MTTDSRARPQQTVLKEKSGYWAAILLWTAASAALLLLFVLAEGESLLKWIPWSLVVAAFAYIFLWIPRLVFDDDSVLIVNSFRSHAIPFAVVDDVSTGSTVTIRAAGRAHQLGCALSAQRAGSRQPAQRRDRSGNGDALGQAWFCRATAGTGTASAGTRLDKVPSGPHAVSPAG